MIFSCIVFSVDDLGHESEKLTMVDIFFCLIFFSSVIIV